MQVTANHDGKLPPRTVKHGGVYTMNAKRTIKKILALGAGVAMVGATIMGAMAYDLATYPAPFITNGVFSGKIVIGANAQAADTIGAVAIGTGLQAEAVSNVPVNIPGATGQVSLSGDTFRLASGSNRLELRRAIGDLVDTVTGSDLQGLTSGHLSTSAGDTDYNQYIHLKDITSGTDSLQQMGVNYVTNDAEVMGDYLVVDVGKPFMEWEINFPSGFESSTYDANSGATTAWASGSASELKDLEDETFNIMGQDFTVVQASVTSAKGLHMLLMGGSAPLNLKEGETQTVTINGVDHEVSLMFVSNPSGSNSQVQAKFMVDNEETRALNSGDTETLAGGLQIGVRDILVNSQGGVASIFLGAHKIVLDSPALDGSFGGTIKIDQETASDGEVAVQGQFTDSTDATFRINDIKYQLTMDATSSSTAYVPQGNGIRALMYRPAELISDAFNIKYEGLENATTNAFTVLPEGSDRYRVTFTNIQGQTYTFPYVSNQNGVWRFGDQNYAFVFVTPAASTDYNVGRNDYFVVSNGGVSPDTSVTNVLRYQSYDRSSNTVSFNDLSTGAQNQVVLTATGSTTNASAQWPASGNLYVGGHTYTVFANDINSATLAGATPLLAVDLQGQGFTADKGMRVDLTLWGGVIVDLGAAMDVGGNASNTVTWLNDGYLENISTTNTADTVNMSMSVLAKNFADQGTSPVATTIEGQSVTLGEGLSWQVLQSGSASNPQVDLSTSKNSYFGPHENSASLYSEFVLDQKDPSSNSDHKVGMTDWGIRVDDYKPSDTTTPGSLTLQVPQSEEFAQVFMTMGSSTSSNTTGGATAQQVNPIAVGYAVLDKDAPALGSENMIVVGGPCVNTVAAALMGNPADCTTGFTAGTAMIQSYEQNGKVAILVAGYDSQDSLGAAYALANHKDYPTLKGTGVQVVVPSLNAITVQAVTPPAMRRRPRRRPRRTPPRKRLCQSKRQKTFFSIFSSSSFSSAILRSRKV